jgi:hypothetical protein
VRKGEFFAMASFLNRPITVPAAALSHALPTVPIEAVSPSRATVSVKRTEVYCDPETEDHPRYRRGANALDQAPPVLAVHARN